MDLITSFIIASGIVLLGFAANALFRRTYIPDTLSLLFLGILLGPLFEKFTGFTVFPHEQLLGSLPYIAQLTLALVIFDAGMSLDIYKILRESPKGVVFSIFTFTFSTIFITLTVKYFLHLRWSYSLFIGSILATAGSATVVPLAMKISLGDEIRHITVIEAALTDVYSLVAATTLIYYMTGTTANIQMAAKQLVSSVSVGILIGAFVGLFWIYVMEQLSKEEHSYVATLGALLAAYTITTWLDGSGAMAALAFGIMIGNHRFITLILGIETPPLMITDLAVTTKSIHGEITFIVRSFFFVAMGLLYTWPSGQYLTVFLGILFSVLLLGARALSVAAVTGRLSSEVWAAASLYGRGLVPALFAQILITQNIPMANVIYELVLNTIIITNIIMTLGVYLAGRSLKKKEEIALRVSSEAPAGGKEV